MGRPTTLNFPCVKLVCLISIWTIRLTIALILLLVRPLVPFPLGLPFGQPNHQKSEHCIFFFFQEITAHSQPLISQANNIEQ